MARTKGQLISPVGILTASGINVSGVATANRFIGDIVSSGVSTITNLRSTNINSTGIITASTVNDSNGNVRYIPQNPQISAYILSSSDSGKHVGITTGGVTVPASVFSTGDVVSIYNNSSSSQTITQGSSVTMYLVGTASTGNRTLAQRGVATVLCVGTNTFVIMGGGLT